MSTPKTKTWNIIVFLKSISINTYCCFKDCSFYLLAYLYSWTLWGQRLVWAEEEFYCCLAKPSRGIGDRRWDRGEKREEEPLVTLMKRKWNVEKFMVKIWYFLFSPSWSLSYSSFNLSQHDNCHAVLELLLLKQTSDSWRFSTLVAALRGHLSRVLPNIKRDTPEGKGKLLLPQLYRKTNKT